MDKNSLAHTTWECKYHIVFAPKYRRKIIYNKLRADIGRILSELCKRKGVEIIEAEACPDHIHMFVRIPLKYSVSEIMGYLKGKSSLMIFERHVHLKYKYGNRLFRAGRRMQCGRQTFQYPFRGRQETAAYSRRANHQLSWWFYPFLDDGCRKKMRTLKIKKVDDKPMVIPAKEKAKIYSHEPKGARIKDKSVRHN